MAEAKKRHRWAQVDKRPVNQKAKCQDCQLIRSKAPGLWRTDFDLPIGHQTFPGGLCLSTNGATPSCPPQQELIDAALAHEAFMEKKREEIRTRGLPQ